MTITKTKYSINGVDMSSRSANPMGWAIMREGTNQLGGIQRSLNKVVVPGYDGHFSGPSTRTEQLMIFNISTPRENLEALLSVLEHVGVDASFPNMGKIEVSVADGKAAYFELVSAVPASARSNDDTVKVTATLSIPYGGWRDEVTTETTTVIPVTPTVITAVGAGSSLPIRDMDIFIQGDVGTIQIEDSKGSWLRTTSRYVFAAGSGIFYQGSTGRAYRAANTSTWEPTADLGFAVDVSGGGGLRVTPKFNPATPNTRSGELTVLSALTADVSVKIRWRGAYILK